MNKRTRWLGLVLALATSVTLLNPGSAFALPPGARKIGLICTPGTVAGPTHTFNLVTKTGYIQTPDGNSVFMWSYANLDAPDSGQFQFVGPVLCVTQGETVVVNLTNTLSEAASIVFPGQEGVAATGGSPGLLTNEAAATNGTVSYSFIAGNPGTYLYESGSDISKQIEMGLYSALVVRPSLGANYAYDATTQFDPSREYMLLLSEYDPDLHHAIETGGAYDFNALHNRYFAINGRNFPDSIQDNGSVLLPNQPYGALVRIQPYDPATLTGTLPVLIRMLNAGALNHPFHPHGNHTVEIAQDARLILSPAGGAATTEHYGETIGSGQTKDYLMRWDDSATGNDTWDPNTNPLPVTLPNYRNLDFKGGNTFYSGNPYLGYKGTLPVGATSHSICGEWYFPLHSHALNEFTNFDEGFGGMGTLLRVDPAGGCFGFPSASVLAGGALKSGTVTALGQHDGTYYQVNPKTTTRPSTTSIGQTSITVASAAGFPSAGVFYIRIDNEIMQVTGGQGTTTWTVVRGQLGTTAATHGTNAKVTALATDWYASFSGVALGALNLKVTYEGKNCGDTTSGSCTSIASGNEPQQTVKICNWTVAGAAGCATATSSGWAILAAPPAQPQIVSTTDVSSTWTVAGPSWDAYIGTGAYKGQVRLLIHTERWFATTPATVAPFSTWGNFMKLVYDAP